MSTIFYKHKELFVSILIILAALVVSYGIVALAGEHDPLEDIIYPVAELGNCENEADCMAYCDEIEHLGECILFAEEHDLLTSEELEEAEKFLAAGAVGPGGCTSHDSCDLYCNDIANIDECIRFGEEHDTFFHFALGQICAALGYIFVSGCSVQSCSRAGHT